MHGKMSTYNKTPPPVSAGNGADAKPTLATKQAELCYPIIVQSLREHKKSNLRKGATQYAQTNPETACRRSLYLPV